jgi:hypothetical protein
MRASEAGIRRFRSLKTGPRTARNWRPILKPQCISACYWAPSGHVSLWRDRQRLLRPGHCTDGRAVNLLPLQAALHSFSLSLLSAEDHVVRRGRDHPAVGQQRVPGTQTGVDLDVFADSIFERLEKRENEIRIWPRLCAPRPSRASFREGTPEAGPCRLVPILRRLSTQLSKPPAVVLMNCAHRCLR